MEKIRRIAIPEGGQGHGFAVGKIKTALQGGGSCFWVPRSAVTARRLTARENRVYLPEENDLFGFSEVVANVNTYCRNGNRICYPGSLRIAELPASIEIVHPPLWVQQGIPYRPGDPVDTTGLVVRALMEDGTEWPESPIGHGIVPINEVIIIPDVSPEKCSQTDHYGIVPFNDTGGTLTGEYLHHPSGLSGYIEHKDEYVITVNVSDGSQKLICIDYVIDGLHYAAVYCAWRPIYISNYRTEAPTVSWRYSEHVVDWDYPGQDIYHVSEWTNPWGSKPMRSLQGSKNYMRDGLDVWYKQIKSNDGQVRFDNFDTTFPVVEIPSDTIGQFLWEVYFGEAVIRNSIVVQWPRPGDGEILSASFEIQVIGSGAA